MPRHEFRAIYMPYCLKKLEDGSFIVLNRNYKPLGFTTLDHVKYEDYPINSKMRGLTPKNISHIAFDGKISDDGFIFLYNDGCIPTEGKVYMDAYLKRLAALAGLETKVEE